ncbi:hypothetical protein [Caulobacter sp. NIBR1757]|uniref:hypothetical protein n=1 Tax=Caulobacter sp. NIBR1757 TaxID=3016000 RepID=UPI0022F0BEF9|nr:hypothetical protein [Caulobacter sp. NIBR1757]
MPHAGFDSGGTRVLHGLGPQLTATPDILLHSLDPVHEAAYLVRLTSRHYLEASFLDDRVLGDDTPGLWARLDEIAEHTAALPERCDFIFHVGHVGSTLLSRLLGAAPGIHALREPTALPLLAQMHAQLSRPESLWSPERFEEVLGLCLKLWSRTYGKGQVPLVKATSWASELAPALLARPSKPRALMMTASPESWLAGVLSSQHGLGDVRASAAIAMARLHRRLGAEPWRLHTMSLGERAALVWTTEMLAMDTAARANPDQVLGIDFDIFLADPAQGLTKALKHLGQPADSTVVQAIVSSPLMSRYAKNLGQSFTAATRRQLQATSRANNAEEIRKGVAWIDAAASRFPAIARFLEPCYRDGVLAH